MEPKDNSRACSAKKPRLNEDTTIETLVIKIEDDSDKDSELDDDANYQWEENKSETSECEPEIGECSSDSDDNDQTYETILQCNGFIDSDKEIDSEEDDEEWDESDQESDEDNKAIDSEHKEHNMATSSVRSRPYWTKLPFQMREIPFTKKHHFLAPIKSHPAIDFFFMVATENFFELIINETNFYAKTISSSWEPLGLKELYKFLGIVLHMSNIRLLKTKHYWESNALLNIPCFKNSMSYKRFKSIMKHLAFARNPPSDDSSDKLWKVRPLIEFFNNRMKEIYYPTKELIIDESMILWRNKLVFRQFSKDAENKTATKLYSLRDSKGMVVKCSIYNTKIDDKGTTNHAAEVVLDLLKDKLNVGHSVYLDYYYNSYDLSYRLLEQNTYTTGTLRKSSKANPKGLKVQPEPGKTIFRFSNGVLIGKCYDLHHDTIYISTEHDNKMVDLKNQFYEQEMKPKLIAEYKKIKSEVKDLKDPVVSHYHSTRKNLEWDKKVGIHLIELMVLNAFKLFCLSEVSCSDMRGIGDYEFRLALINRLLLGPKIRKKKTTKPGVIDKQIPHFISKYSKLANGRQMRRRCRHCHNQNVRRDSMFYCQTCPDAPALCCDCFDPYHM
ncbi:piggyBac transposable element-derived protein 4-like [Anthonomus grandis grandis]|uniref:piggyBac transposable element-derived protein 4-like n=1 Tax=Anthonomus grandis grandis TaxID=2921223 RepID=UPI00216604F2|nr:piggyBac transposable element-derived protein 4-like [Anthonomus grandis grandis]